MITNINTILTLKDKQYSVNWDLQQVNVLIGENGSGKTKLLRQIELDYDCFLIDQLHTPDYTINREITGILDVSKSYALNIFEWFKELTNIQIYLGFDKNEYMILSKGHKYLLNLLTNIHLRPRNSTVLIDDIEQNLDLHTQRKLLPLLTSKRPDLQFIVTTHSPEIIPINNADWITRISNILTEM